MKNCFSNNDLGYDLHQLSQKMSSQAQDEMKKTLRDHF